VAGGTALTLARVENWAFDHRRAMTIGAKLSTANAKPQDPLCMQLSLLALPWQSGMER